MKYIVCMFVFATYVGISAKVWGFDLGDAMAQATTISVIALILANWFGLLKPSKSTRIPKESNDSAFGEGASISLSDGPFINTIGHHDDD